MAASNEEVRKCLRGHLIDVVRFLEGGNHDCNAFDHTLFRLDWVLNVLTRYLDTETTRAYARIVHLVREMREAVTNANHSRSTDAFQASSIFTGQRGRPKLKVPQEQLQFLLERRFNTPQIASLLGVSQRTVERRLSECNLNISTCSNLSNQELDAVIRSILTDFPQTGYKRMTGFLRARGLVVQSRIHAGMRRTNPEGTLLRALGIHFIRRRSYQVAGPLALWHIDGNHKLIK